METFTENLNFFASLGTIVGQIFILFIIILWLYARLSKKSPNNKWAEDLLSKIGSRSLVIAFLISLVAVIISLIYSEVIGFEPCKLCWIQRIFLYPQVIILGLALWKKTKGAAIYCLTLSTIGALIALYHFYGQSFNPSALGACGATGAASCAVRFFVEFGYITIPMMSLTTFLIIALCMVLNKTWASKSL